MHSLTVRASGNFQVLITALKVALIVTFILIGIARGGAWTFSPHGGDSGLIFSGPFAVSLMFVLYSYSGWNAAAYIIGEVRDAQRTVPGALILATIIVMILIRRSECRLSSERTDGRVCGKNRGRGDCRPELTWRARRAHYGWPDRGRVDLRD